MKKIRQATANTRRAMQRWLHADERNRDHAYEQWQIAESARRRAILTHSPLNGRRFAL